MRTLHVIQHTSAEYLGLIEDHLEGRGVRFRYHRPFTSGGTLPAAAALADGLVLLGGGPWGSAGEKDLPTLGAEIVLARAALERGVPLVGIGLGAQIVALAAGGGSRRSPLAFRVGTARRCAPDALNGYLPDEYPLAVYGRDRPVLPQHARILAQDAEGSPALWELEGRAWGFAGHPGLKVAMVEDLVMEFEDAPEDFAAVLPRLAAVQHALEDALVPVMTGLVQCAKWMEPVVGSSEK